MRVRQRTSSLFPITASPRSSAASISRASCAQPDSTPWPPSSKRPKAGQIMVVGNAGTVLFYIIEHDRAVTARLVEWLQHSDFAGVIFTREKFEGAFPLESVRAKYGRCARRDGGVALERETQSLRHPRPDHTPIPARGAGKGSHVTLSEFDVHNTLIAVRSQLPSRDDERSSERQHRSRAHHPAPSRTCGRRINSMGAFWRKR